MNPAHSGPEYKRRKATRATKSEFTYEVPTAPDRMAAGPILLSPQQLLPGIGSFATPPPIFPARNTIQPSAPSLLSTTNASSPSSAASTTTLRSQPRNRPFAGAHTGITHTQVGSPQGRPGFHNERPHGYYPSYPAHGVKRAIDELSSSSGGSMQYPQSARRPTTSTQPHTTGTIITLPNPDDLPLPPAPSNLPKERFVLHLRQQPRAARAGPDGKDRRTIDPPPVLQLLVKDLDFEKDGRYLRDRDWVVFVKLAAAPSPSTNAASTQGAAQQTNSEPRESVSRSLLGTMVSSPFYCETDPDPDTAPKHPLTNPSPPPSPTSRFLPRSKNERDPDAHKKLPGAFFIFADLSVRKAGQFRLEFRLMKMEPSALVLNHAIPTIATVVSDVFNVVNAKDFDQVQPSTELVKGLLDQGAGFPLKLKKGLRKTRHGAEEEDAADNDSEDDNS